ncbi:olfactory receptor 1G1-like [Lissotriton helveticus]
MEGENLTSEEQFLIIGFTDLPLLQVPLFIAFLTIYVLTLIGNLLIVSIVYSNSHLHTPMYFFLLNVAFIDITNISVTFPPMLIHFFQTDTIISLTKCLLQIYLFLFLLGTEFLILTVMAYDRYVAICYPLHYLSIMNKNMCIQLATGSWLGGILAPLPHITLISRLSYCQSHTINHFFCDFTALMKLSCTSIHGIETLNYVIGSIFALAPFIIVFTSYVKIISSILNMKSTEGRRKTFSTCGSHLTVVILFFGSVCSTYMRPTSKVSIKENKILALLYTAVPPLCNPIIYSLKNEGFAKGFRKTKSNID